MKSSTLLQSVLLASGLLLGSVPAAQADHTYSIVPISSYLYSLLNQNYSPGNAPWWASGRHNPGSGNVCHHGEHGPKHHGKHDRGNGHGHDHHDHWSHGWHEGHGDRHEQGNHWKHGRHDGRGDGHDHKHDRQHGRHDGPGNRHDHKLRKEHVKRDGNRSRSAGIGYTGRS